MIRFIVPIILLGIAVSGFFVFTNPMYVEVGELRAKLASYNEALGNSKALENERDKLTGKYNAISKDDLDKLEKLLPENIDNIRLILEIEKIASPYGMVLKDVKYDTSAKEEKADKLLPTVSVGAGLSSVPENYGVWNLAFSTSGSYNNFLNFTRDLENNLRVVDIESVEFSSDTAPRLLANLPETYKYDFKIKTYWLKN